jgi:hypothetical protein
MPAAELLTSVTSNFGVLPVRLMMTSSPSSISSL